MSDKPKSPDQFLRSIVERSKRQLTRDAFHKSVRDPFRGKDLL